jgi:hypothetical protein
LTENRNHWFERHADAAAVLITLLGFAARIWMASGTFLNPDEALHFRLANQPSLVETYKLSLTNSHPPLLFFLLHFWRVFGTSELSVRLPSVIAGTIFCWVFYKWLARAAGDLAGLIGLFLAGLLPPMIRFSAEVRQYALLIAFLAGAVYLLDEAFDNNSPGRMALSSICLGLALLSQYSALLLAAALGIYALSRIFSERFPARLLAPWAVGQLGVLALAIFLYKTHLSKLGGQGNSALRGWLRYYIPSYFNPAHDKPLPFVAGHSFGIFQYFFGQLAVGDVMGLLFLIAVVLLLRGKGAGSVQSSRRLGVLLLSSFAVAAGAGLSQTYPYGGTRHMAFLILPAIAGVSVAVTWLAAGKWARGIGITLLVVAACAAFGKPRQPWISRSDQNRAHMAAAMDFIRENVNPTDLIFTDYQSDLIVGHYLCNQRPISMEPAPADFEGFSCDGHRIASMDFRGWSFASASFVREWQRFVDDYALKPGTAVWVFQAGWGVDLPEDLQKSFVEFHELHFESFGKNIKIFKMTVGQPVPVSAP